MTTYTSLFVEIELVLVTRPLDLAGVRVLKVRLDDVVPIFPNSPKTSFLHDGSDNSTTQWIIPYDQAVQVDLRG